MINETTYAALAAGLQEAFADLERHMDDPDNSRLSAQGMLELTRDRLASLTAALFAPGMPPIIRPAAPTLEPTDAWGRPRCQEIGTYVDTPERYQCALVAEHEGECDPLPVWPDAVPPASTWTDTRDDDGRWLAGQSGCPRGCGHVLMAHRTDVGCVSCDCQHGTPGAGAHLIDREKSHVLPADLAEESDH